MPIATPFRSFGSISDTDPNAALFTGFPYCPESIDVSGFDYWTSLSGWSKVNTPADDAAKAQSIEDSREIAMKLFWNYNGHSVDIDFSGDSTTLTIDIEQDEFDAGSATAPFEPEDRACSDSGWNAARLIENAGYLHITGVGILVKRMYNGSTSDESNFVGYGVVDTFQDGSAFAALGFDEDIEFNFSSYINDDRPFYSSTFEYSDAIEGIWFVASAESAVVANPSISGLTATFDGTYTITYKDFDFWTYPT